MARTGARPGDWKTTPLPAITAAVPFTRSFSADELRRLQQGLIPERMEDRWFVVWEDDALWLYRSWTGMCVFRLRFAADGDRFAVSEVVMNRDPQRRGDDGQDIWMLQTVLDTVLRYAR